jgi:hypothetical protein
MMLKAFKLSLINFQTLLQEFKLHPALVARNNPTPHRNASNFPISTTASAISHT